MSDQRPWNDGEIGERMRRLRHDLESNQWVADVDLRPGGALDAMRIWLRESSGTVPRSVAESIYERGLEIRSVGGYKSVTVSTQERFGGDLDESEVIRR